MKYVKMLTAVLVFCFAVASPRWMGAGLVDEVPLLNGTTKAKTVWSTGAFATNTTAAAVFACTSTEKLGGKNITWGVEVFHSSAIANDLAAGVGVVSTGPGETWVVATRDTLFFDEDDVIGVDTTFGSARIVATSSKLVCTAYIVERFSNPPTMMVMLPLFNKTKQKGQ